MLVRGFDKAAQAGLKLNGPPTDSSLPGVQIIEVRHHVGLFSSAVPGLNPGSHAYWASSLPLSHIPNPQECFLES